MNPVLLNPKCDEAIVEIEVIRQRIFPNIIKRRNRVAAHKAMVDHPKRGVVGGLVYPIGGGPGVAWSGKWVNHCRVVPDLEMEVGIGGVSGTSHQGNRRSGFHAIANVDQRRAAPDMGVVGVDSPRMGNRNPVAKPARNHANLVPVERRVNNSNHPARGRGKHPHAAIHLPEAAQDDVGSLVPVVGLRPAMVVPYHSGGGVVVNVIDQEEIAFQRPFNRPAEHRLAGGSGNAQQRQQQAE